MIKSDSISNLAGALVKAQAEMGNASKGSANPFFKSRYADLNAIREACIPVLSKHGLSVIQPTIYVDGKKFVETMIMHESGEYIGGHTEILSVKEMDAQAQGSGISYARRYGLQSLLCIGAEDDDGSAAVGRSVSNNVPQKPIVKQASAGSETPVKPVESPKVTGGGFGLKKPQVETIPEIKEEDGGWS